MPENNSSASRIFSQTDLIHAAGTQIACHRHGRGPTILCLHATGHSARDFIGLAHALGHAYEFIAVDWPGHGESPRDTIAPSANRYAQILGELVSALDLQAYTLLGNSIGGAAAIIYASARPGQVRSMVLCNPGGLQPVNLIARLYCRHMSRFFASGERGDAKFARKFRRYYEKTVLPKQPAAWRREEIIASGHDVAPILRAAWESFADPQADIRPLVAKLTMPVLYAWARGDQAVSWGRSKTAALSAANCELSLFDCGHTAFLESPDEFQVRLGEFLT